MFIKIWQPITLYIDRMDWRARHLTTTEGTGGGAFANKNCPQCQAFEQFFQMPGRECWRLELTHTLHQNSFPSVLALLFDLKIGQVQHNTPLPPTFHSNSRLVKSHMLTPPPHTHTHTHTHTHLDTFTESIISH